MPLYGSTNENAWMHLKKKHFSSKKVHLFIYRFLPYKSLSKVRTSEFCHAIHAVNHAVNHAGVEKLRTNRLLNEFVSSPPHLLSPKTSDRRLIEPLIVDNSVK